MMTKILRGVIIASLSACVISFVIFFFAPLLPFKILGGFQEILFFFIVIGISYVVYLLLPPDSPEVDSVTQTTEMNHSSNID
ncbi:MAG: hypothetical protein ACXAC8_12605 [Candidatus Hodarchaeales archaeon]|jgi:hypothetical protein